MWLRKGANSIKLPSDVDSLRFVSIRTNGMAYPVIHCRRGEFPFYGVVSASAHFGKPTHVYHETVGNRLWFYPAADKRYAVTVTALIVKTL